MTNILAVMVVWMSASTIDISTATRSPIPYTRDYECPCSNNGRIGGVWLNYYSPCRFDDTTIVLYKPLLPPLLRDDFSDTQLHSILYPSVYAPSLNPGYFGDLHHSVFMPLDGLQPHRAAVDYLLDFSPHDFDNQGTFFKERFLNIGHGLTSTPLTVAPEPVTLVLLAIGMTIIARRGMMRVAQRKVCVAAPIADPDQLAPSRPA